MRVVCDNCGASYRIPDHKLVKEVNKATCRKCGEAIIIRRSAGMSVGSKQTEVDPEANTQVTEVASIGGGSDSSPKTPPVASIPSGPAMGHGFGHPEHLPDDAGPPTVAQQMDFKDETIPRQDLPEQTRARPDLGRTAPPLPPVSTTIEPSPPQASPPQASPPQASPPQAQSGRTPLPPNQAHDSSGDLTVVMMSNFACAAGALFIVAAQEPWHRPMGFFVCLAGAFLSVSILVTSDRGRKAASMLGSYAVALGVAGASAYGLHVYDQEDSPVNLAANTLVVPAAEDSPTDAEASANLDQDILEEEAAEEKSEEEPAGRDEAPSSNSGVRNSASSASSSSSLTPAARQRAPEPEPEPAPTPRRDWENDDFDDWEEPEPEPPPRRRTPPPPPREPEPEPEPASEGVPVQVLDTMLRNNRSVKMCFVDYSRQTGERPSGRIVVKIRMQSSGRTSSARIDGGPYAGTSLDTCLNTAIGGIQFPPFSGASKTYRYPFVL